MILQLGKTAHRYTENLITWLKLRDSATDRFNPTRDVSAEHRVFGLEKPLAQANQEWCTSHPMPVKRICRCGIHFHQYLMILCPNHTETDMSSADNFWLTPPANLMLSRDEVHVWRATLDVPDIYLDELQHMLAPDEIRRAEQFRLQRDRHRFIVGRGLLRAILSLYLRIAPHQIFFSYTAFGKPLLAPSVNQDGLNFNTSHSDGLAVYALTRERAIGVDIEHNRNSVDYKQLAMRFFSPTEYAQLCSLPREIQLKAFFTGWTCKEAYIKAHGEGLSLPLDQFTVALGPHQPAQLLHTLVDPNEASRWSLQALRPGLDYTAALCVEGQGWRLTCWQWPEEWPYRGT